MVIEAMIAAALVAAPVQDGRPVSDPATLHRADVTSIMVIVPDCQGWQANETCAVVARPPKRCVMDQQGRDRLFGLLSAAVAAPRRAAPRASDYATARILIELTGGRMAIAEIPLYPEMEKGGRTHLWIDYGARRVRLSRANWDEIAQLAQSYHCEKQPRVWDRRR